MRDYKVWVKDHAEAVKISADDVELNTGEGDKAFWNFLVGNPLQDAVTVGAFPFDNVDYIVS